MSTVIRPKRRCTCEATGGEQDMSVDSTGCPVHGRRCPTCGSHDPATHLVGVMPCPDPFHGLSGAAGSERGASAERHSGPAESDQGDPPSADEVRGILKDKLPDQGEGERVTLIQCAACGLHYEGWPCPYCGEEPPQKVDRDFIPADQPMTDNERVSLYEKIGEQRDRTKAAEWEAEENAQASHENFWRAEAAEHNYENERVRRIAAEVKAEAAERKAAKYAEDLKRTDELEVILTEVRDEAIRSRRGSQDRLAKRILAILDGEGERDMGAPFDQIDQGPSGEGEG